MVKKILFLIFIFSISLYSQTWIGNITGYNQSGNDVNFQCGTPLVRITLCTADMVRVRVAPSGTFQTKFSDEPYMVKKYTWPSVSYTLTDGGSYYQIETSKMIVRVQKSPCIISFYDKNLNIITKDNDTNRMGWNGSNWAVYCGKDMYTGEKFFGLGEQYAPDNNSGIMNFRGYTMEIWNQDSQCEDYRPSYCNVPWVVSNRKYGIFFHNPGRIYFRFGTESSNRWSFESRVGELDYYFIYGGSDSRCYKTLLDRYTELTGRPQLPPDWVFGLGVIIGANTVSSAATTWRNSQVPGDMIGIDAWWDTAVGSFQFSSDGQDNVNAAHNNNFKLWVWQVPVINPSASTNYNTGSSNGYFGKNTSGGVYSVTLWGSASGGYVDFFKQSAKDWYKNLCKNVRGSGGSVLNPMLDCFKTDDGEYTPDDTGFLFLDGTYNGREVHNPYGLIYNETVYEAVKEMQGRGFVFHRCSYAGGQRNPVLWAGDNGSTFHDASEWGKAGMDNTLRAGLCAAWSGFAHWTSDSGGCDGTRPTDELFQRWVCEWSNFMPCHVINDYTGGNRAFWFYSSAMQDVMRRYTRLHYRLFPYFYSYAYKAWTNGEPIMRPMLMEFPNDPKCEEIGGRPTTTIDGQSVMGQYMLGDWMMICPVTESGVTSRNVYFPTGKWTNYWDETVINSAGSVINVSAPVDIIPVFIKAGAIIPMVDERTYMRQIANNRITLDIYPSGYSSFLLYEDDGNTEQYKTGSYATTLFECTQNTNNTTINIGARQGTYSGMPSSRYYYLQIHGINSQPDSVRKNTTVLTRYNSTTELNSATEGWYYDSSKKIVHVKPSQSTAGAFVIGVNMVPAGSPTQLIVNASPKNLPADGTSTSEVTASVCDANGILVMSSNAQIRFTLSGTAGGTLQGTNPVNAVNGVATITYRAGSTQGTATITATSSGLTQGSVDIVLASGNPPNEPSNLLTDGKVNPKGLTVYTPELRWTFSDNDSGSSQSAYRVLVANNLNDINSDNGNMWDTQKVTSGQSYTTYAGTALSQGGTYYWKVMVWDNTNLPSPYSQVASFTMASAPPVPAITVISPNGGETWMQGTVATIRWTSQGSVNNLNIDLSTDAGTNWTNLVSNTQNDGTQTVTVPQVSSSLCRVRVSETDGTPSDISDANFTISSGGQNNPPLKPSTPSGPNFVRVGTQYSYSSYSTDPDGDKIYYTFNWGDTTSSDTALMNSGSTGTATHIWTSTGATGIYLVNVRATDINGGVSPWSESIAVNVIPADSPFLKVSQTSLDFGEVPLGEITTQIVEITNIGGGTLSGTVTTDRSWIDVQPQSFTGNNILLNITVDNEILGERQGNYTGTVTINSNGGNAEIQVTLTATCVLVKPNPYNPDKEVLEFFGTGIVPGKTTIRIYTLSGELIWENSKNQGISDRIIWDGNDLKGRKVLSGIYIYTYESEKEKGSGKITVIRK